MTPPLRHGRQWFGPGNRALCRTRRSRRARSRKNRRTAQSHRTRLNYQREETMLQKIRRVVTGHNAAGKAVILFDDHAPNVNPLKGWPGAGVTEVWVTDEMPVSNLGSTDRSLRPMRHDPTPSGTIFRVVEIPPEAAGAKIDAGATFGQIGRTHKPSEG